MVAPRRAFATANDRRHAGRSGTDLILIILLLLAATQAAALVRAGWLGAAVGAGLGLRAATVVLTHTLTVDLGFLVIGAFVLWLAAGPRRDLGRVFDLACVAALPLFLVDLTATAAVRIAGLEVPMIAGWLLAGLAWGWTGALLALGLRPARNLPVGHVAPPAGIAAHARRAGLVVLAIAALGTAAQAVRIARDLDALRPVHRGTSAPAFALPEIGPGGALGARTELAALAGNIVVVDFWATWCQPCLRALPRLEQLTRRPGVRVLAINLDDAAEARALFDRGRFRMTLLADDRVTSERYAVSMLPHTVVIDRAGRVHAVVRGASADVAALVDELAPEPGAIRAPRPPADAPK